MAAGISGLRSFGDFTAFGALVVSVFPASVRDWRRNREVRSAFGDAEVAPTEREVGAVTVLLGVDPGGGGVLDDAVPEDGGGGGGELDMCLR